MSQEYTTYAYADLWKHFLGAFKDVEDKEKTGYGTYFQKIISMRVEDTSRFVLDYADLDQYTLEHPDSKIPTRNLMELILQDPDEARFTLRSAVMSILSEVDPDYQLEIAKNLRCDFKGIPIVKEIPDMDVDDVDRPISMDGIIIEADERISAEVLKFCYRCDEGHYTYTTDDRKPSRCSGSYDNNNDYIECKSLFFTPVPKRDETINFIEFKVQQRLDRIDEKKKTSVDMGLVATGRDLTKFITSKLHLADYTTINGIIRLEKQKIKGRGNRHVATLYMDVMDIDVKPESSLIQYDPTYADLVKLAVTPENEIEDYKKLLRSVCPSYYSSENDVVKEALLLLLVGADERKNRDNTRLRGELQILLLGDKGGGKSLLLKWLRNCRERTFYTSGSKTSAVSLVGGMRAADEKGRPAKAVVGIFGMADMVIIDELEKRKPEEIDALAEPMQDSQSIHIGKQLQILEQDLAVAVAAGANPTGGLAKYDITKDIFTNTKLPAWLLDRFDSIFIMRDVVNKQKDEALFEHIIATRKQSKTRQQFEQGKHDFKRLADDYYPVGYMRQWVQYVRDTFHPSVADSQEAIDVIHKFFTEYRRLNIRQPHTKEERENWTKDNEMPAVHWRTLQSLLRYSEASARAHHRNTVTAADAEIAVKIVQFSIASSGINNLTQIQSDLEEVKAIEDKVNNEAERAVILQQYRDASYDTKVFTQGLVKLSKIPCGLCKGKGFKFDLGDRHKCENCNGERFKNEPFDLSMLQQYCKERNVLPKAFEMMWKRCILEKMITPVEEMPGLYNNNREDTSIGINFAQMPKTDIEYEDANSLYIKALKARNRPLKEYIDQIADNEEL